MRVLLFRRRDVARYVSTEGDFICLYQHNQKDCPQCAEKRRGRLRQEADFSETQDAEGTARPRVLEAILQRVIIHQARSDSEFWCGCPVFGCKRQ